MTDEGFPELLVEVMGNGEPTWDPLIVVGSTLSMLSCGVVLTVMLASDLRKASWTPYVVLWALAQLLLQLLSLTDSIVNQVSSRGEEASTVGCQLYLYLQLKLPFLSMTAMAALSLDRLFSSVRPSGWGRRGPRYVVLGLLLVSVLVYGPFFAVKGATYHHYYITCLPKQPPSSGEYFLAAANWTTIVVDPLGLLVVLVGGLGFWRLETRKRDQRSRDLRLLATFLLGFVLLSLPSSLVTVFYLNATRVESPMNILHAIFRVCFFFGPVVLLGCLASSPMFLRAMNSVFRPASTSIRQEDLERRRVTTEMTEREEETKC